MRSRISLFEDQYKFYKVYKSKKLLCAFVEYMFEDIEPKNLSEKEQIIFESLRERMQKSKQISDGNSKGGQTSSRGKVVKNTEGNNRSEQESSDKSKGKSTISQRVSQPGKKNNEVEVEVEVEVKENCVNKLTQKENENDEKLFATVWQDIPSSRGGNEKEGKKMYMQKIQSGMSGEMIYKLAELLKFEIREKVKEITYSQKKENWIRDVCPQTEDEMEVRIIEILKARYKRMENGVKFKANTVAELCDIFGKEYIGGLWKEVQVEVKKRFNL